VTLVLNSVGDLIRFMTFLKQNSRSQLFACGGGLPIPGTGY
jgi:hypothetical protein